MSGGGVPASDVVCVRGEAFVQSDPSGDVIPGTAQGLYVRDTRFLDRLQVFVDGSRPTWLSGGSLEPGRCVFHGYVPLASDLGVDPTVILTRHRSVHGSLREELVVDNRSREAHELTVEIAVGSDFAYIVDVKHARQQPAGSSRPDDGGLLVTREGGPERTVVRADQPVEVTDDRIRWQLRLAPGGSATLGIDVEVTDGHGTTAPLSTSGAGEGSGGEDAAGPDLRASDERLSLLLTRGLQDLRALQLTDPEEPADRFCGAGVPWYLTLFGRDALWAAFMALPYDLELAAGTLRALARRQGSRVDPETEEAPGKIPHEIRRGGLAERGDLPPTYYGTVDATPLFVVLAHEAWQWGLDRETVRGLLPHIEAALAWMRDHGDPDGDGFLEYVQQGERGLSNQGWKDSRDAIQFVDGSLGQPPIALVEVQGYAYDAAMRGAELLERFGRAGAEEWRCWAAELRRRFHERFWLDDADGAYLALALDGQGRAVDAPSSNMGHVLTSGLLDEQQARAVARRLGHPSLDCGWGLRTMADTATGFNPLSYHGGSVWPHDTAIAAWGCAEAGERDVASSLARGLVRAAPAFGHRLPELFAGTRYRRGDVPVPYPASCRPQAWSAGAPLLLLRACLRPRPRLPEGTLTFAPLWPPPFERLELRRVPLAGGELDLVVDVRDGVHHELRGTSVEIDV